MNDRRHAYRSWTVQNLGFILGNKRSVGCKFLRYFIFSLLWSSAFGWLFWESTFKSHLMLLAGEEPVETIKIGWTLLFPAAVGPMTFLYALFLLPSKNLLQLFKQQRALMKVYKFALFPSVPVIILGGWLWSELVIAEKAYVKCPGVYATEGTTKRRFSLVFLTFKEENCPPLTFTGEIEDWRWVLQRRKEAAAQ